MREIKLYVESNFLPRSNEWEVRVYVMFTPSGKKMLLAEDIISANFYPDPDLWVAGKLVGLFDVF